MKINCKAIRGDEMKNAIRIFELVGSENLANNYKKDFARFAHQVMFPPIWWEHGLFFCDIIMLNKSCMNFLFLDGGVIL